MHSEREEPSYVIAAKYPRMLGNCNTICPLPSMLTLEHAIRVACCGAGASLRTSSMTDGQNTVTHRNSGDSAEGNVCVCVLE